MIISISGLIGSGKDTIADFLVAEYGFARESFASTLKDAAAAVFNWDRELLEGRTEVARHWREQVDPWWASRLDIPTLTPRWVLQYWGTEVFRYHFHDDIWIASLENKLRTATKNVVITDCRFPNEVKALKNAGASLVRVKRGNDPEWFSTASTCPACMQTKFPSIHASEYSWATTNFDRVIDNNSSIEHLYAQVKDLVEDHLVAK